MSALIWLLILAGPFVAVAPAAVTAFLNWPHPANRPARPRRRFSLPQLTVAVSW